MNSNQFQLTAIEFVLLLRILLQVNAAGNDFLVHSSIGNLTVGQLGCSVFVPHGYDSFEIQITFFTYSVVKDQNLFRLNNQYPRLGIFYSKFSSLQCRSAIA